MVFILRTRCRFDVDLTDDTGVMTASVFGELAEQLLGISAVAAMNFYNKVYTTLAELLLPLLLLLT